MFDVAFYFHLLHKRKVHISRRLVTITVEKENMRFVDNV